MSATSLSIEPEDLELSPFLVAPTCPSKPRRSWKLGEGGNQHGGLGKAHQLFGEQLPKLLDELNEVLAA
jgi:type I restriction enzyme R subunit